MLKNIYICVNDVQAVHVLILKRGLGWKGFDFLYFTTIYYSFTQHIVPNPLFFDLICWWNNLLSCRYFDVHKVMLSKVIWKRQGVTWIWMLHKTNDTDVFSTQMLAQVDAKTLCSKLLIVLKVNASTKTIEIKAEKQAIPLMCEHCYQVSTYKMVSIKCKMKNNN